MNHDHPKSSGLPATVDKVSPSVLSSISAPLVTSPPSAHATGSVAPATLEGSTPLTLLFEASHKGKVSA